MSTQAIREYLFCIWKQYKSASKEEKTQLLTEVERNLKLHRKAIIRLLNRPWAPRSQQGRPGPRASHYSPDRDLAKAALEAAKTASAGRFGTNGNSLTAEIDGLDASISTLGKKRMTLPIDDVKRAYDIKDPTIVDFMGQLATAELMIRAGTNVISISDNQNWDTHGDITGTRARENMAIILPALKIFTDRMLLETGFNVVVVICGEFARSVPGSNHANSSSTTVFGRYLKNATTGNMNPNASLKPILNNSRTYLNYWSFLSEALQSEAAAKNFGSNPHQLLR